MDNKESWYVTIPFLVFSSKKLMDIDKLVYGEISALTRRDGYAEATNKHFEDVLGISESKLQRSLSRLKDNKLIRIDIEHFKDDKIGTYRKIFLEGVSDMTTGGSHQRLHKEDIHKENNTNVLETRVVSSKDSTNPNRNTINKLGKVKFSYQNIEALKKILKEGYPKNLRGFSDPTTLRSMWAMSQPRKGKDEWMSKDPMENLKRFFSVYLTDREEQYCVGDMFKLNQELRDWRERGGK